MTVPRATCSRSDSVGTVPQATFRGLTMQGQFHWLHVHCLRVGVTVPQATCSRSDSVGTVPQTTC